MDANGDIIADSAIFNIEDTTLIGLTMTMDTIAKEKEISFTLTMECPSLAVQ